jgi:beta-xylosidase
MAYKNTFILVSEDSPVERAVIPQPKKGKPTIASIEYDLISRHPYEFTQDEVQFQTYLIKHAMETERDSDKLQELREQFFAKSRACFRASPLVKQYGWGIHYNEEGKVALYGVNTDEYNRLRDSEQVTKLKGMRSKRT